MVSGGRHVYGGGAITINGTFTLSSGTFTAPTGTFTVVGNWTHTAGGTFNHNSGTVVFGDGSSRSLSIDVATSETFNNLTVNSSTGSGSFTIGTGDTLIVLGTFTHASAPIYTGTIEARGNVVVGGGFVNGGTGTLLFTGTNNQTYTDQGGDELNGSITINKSSGMVSLASNADWNAAGQNLTITSGTLFAPDYSIATGSLTIGASGVLYMAGSQTLTLGGSVANSGTVKIWGIGVCGAGDTALIRSSVAATQRSWLGAGTFTIYDASVQDQGGSSAITVYSSTSVSGNGGNWTFSGAACPSIPPAVTVGSGIFNIGSGVANIK
jgi:hypothetical protein